MEKLRILVLSSPVTDVLCGEQDGAKACLAAFPEQDWRFRDYGACSEEDILWADVITGFPDKAALKKAKNLRWLHLQSAGVNGYEKREQFGNPEILLTRSAGVHAPAMAEHALAMALSLTRKLPRLYQSQLNGAWEPVHARMELHDAQVVLLGTGYLAAALLPLLTAFGCHITGVRRDTGKPTPPGYERMLPTGRLHEALSGADYVFSTLPLTEATRRLMDAAAFQAIKPGAVFINMGRGGTVDTEALRNALESGRLSGAGLDVTEPEPLPENHPLWHSPNCIITPHCSAWSDATDRRRYETFLRLLGLYLRGEPLPGQVDFSVGY